MIVLQDKCPPTSISDIDALLKKDMNSSLAELFSSFDATPIGVASLAQVHKATLKQTGEVVAVKIQHPFLDLYSKIDIKMCADIVKLVKRAFPEFEFDWLALEMQESLPKELDFVCEAENAIRTRDNLKNESSILIPNVFWATRRILCMECNFHCGRDWFII